MILQKYKKYPIFILLLQKKYYSVYKQMINIEIDPQIELACPQIEIGLISAQVVNSATSDELWDEIEREAGIIARTYELLDINKRPAIAATRKLYKSLGKDPGRYRVSSEALCRRIIRGLGLYRLTALIDIVNLVSFKSGYAISGLDADKLVGETLTMGVGKKDEKYCGIGRGPLNIEGLPVYRDAEGGVATPTSDEERTKFTLETSRVQININAFAPEMPLDETLSWTVSLLEKYAKATNIETKIASFK